MDDIKRFLLRLPIDLYGALELEAVQLNTSLNKLIVGRLEDSRRSIPVPTYQKAAVMTRKIAATLPNTMAGCDVPQPKPKPAGCVECGAINGHQKWCAKR